MATLKGTKALDGAQPSGLHAGTNVVYSSYTFTATASIGDVVQMVKVPQGARIVGVSTKSSGAAGGKTGDGASVERYATSANFTAATAKHAVLGIGYKYSFSDDAVVQFDTIDFVVTDTPTALSVGSTLEFIVHYTADES